MSGRKLVISVSGGVVNAVCTDSPDLEVYLVDFDELEADPKASCSASYPVDSMNDFRSAVRVHVNRYPGIKKLIAKLRE